MEGIKENGSGRMWMKRKREYMKPPRKELKLISSGITCPGPSRLQIPGVELS
jgi:hypothetical protein